MRLFEIFVALALLIGLVPHNEARAQWASEAERGLPVVREPTEPALVSPPFDPAEPEYARRLVLKTRNWFLASAGVFGVGWLLLGPGIGQCQEFGGVDSCLGRGDKLSRAGLGIVFVGSLGLIFTLPMYGVRVKQERKLERLTLAYVTYGGRISPSAAFDEYRLADAHDRSRRARNALIGSAVTLGFGSMFIGFAVPRCEMGDGRLLCTDPGYFHFTAGLTLGGAGALGTIVSSVLLRARNKKKKSLTRSVRQRQGFGLRWNPALGAFVF